MQGQCPFFQFYPIQFFSIDRPFGDRSYHSAQQLTFAFLCFDFQFILQFSIESLHIRHRTGIDTPVPLHLESLAPVQILGNQNQLFPDQVAVFILLPRTDGHDIGHILEIRENLLVQIIIGTGVKAGRHNPRIVLNHLLRLYSFARRQVDLQLGETMLELQGNRLVRALHLRLGGPQEVAGRMGFRLALIGCYADRYDRRPLLRPVLPVRIIRDKIQGVIPFRVEHRPFRGQHLVIPTGQQQIVQVTIFRYTPSGKHGIQTDLIVCFENIVRHLGGSFFNLHRKGDGDIACLHFCFDFIDTSRIQQNTATYKWIKELFHGVDLSG